jgi:hypothetical protein
MVYRYLWFLFLPRGTFCGQVVFRVQCGGDGCFGFTDRNLLFSGAAEDNMGVLLLVFINYQVWGSFPA